MNTKPLTLDQIESRKKKAVRFVMPNGYSEIDLPSSDKPRLEIESCTQCRWLLRAAWMAQELLVTFEQEIGGVTLVPDVGKCRKAQIFWT
jgi:hypothetical protein